MDKKVKSKDRVKDILYISIIIILIGIFFSKVLLNTDSLLYSPFSDYIPGQYLLRQMNENLFANGQSFLWYNFNAGTPATALNIHYYLFELLTLVVPFLGLFDYILHFILAGIGTYLFIKLLGRSRFASFISAIIFMFSVKMIAHLYAGHITITYVICYLPITLFIAEMLVRHTVAVSDGIKKRINKKIIYIMLLGLIFGLQFLIGHIQIFMYNVIFVSLYFVYRVIFMECKKGGWIKQGKVDDKHGLNGGSKNWRLLRHSAIAYAIAMIIFVLLSAISIVPLSEYINYHTRGGGTSLSFSATTSLSIFDTVSVILPTFFGTPENYWGAAGNFWEGSVYLGILSVILVIIGLKYAKTKLKYFFLGFGLFAFLYSLGTYTPFYQIVREIIFPLKFFRAPSRLMFYLIFSFAAMAAYGIDFLISEPRDKEEKNRKSNLLRVIIKILKITLIADIVVLCVSIIFRSFFLSIGEKILDYLYNVKYATSEMVHRFSFEYYTDKIPYAFNNILENLFFFGMMVVLVIILFTYLNKNIKIGRLHKDRVLMIAKISITLILVVDLWCISWQLIQVKPKDEIFYDTPLVDFLKEDKELFRVLDLAAAVPSFEHYSSPKYPLEAVTVAIAKFDGLRNTQDLGNMIIDIQNNTIKNYNLLNIFNFKYVILQEQVEVPGLELVYNHEDYNITVWGKENTKGDIFVYKNNNYLPRAFIAYEHKVVEENMLTEMEKEIDFSKIVLLEEEPMNSFERINGGLIPQTENCTKKAEITSKTTTEYIINACLNEEGYVVLLDAWYPGWKAFIDGREIPILKADHAFKAVKLPAGSYELRIVFESETFRNAFWITTISLAAIIILLILLILKPISKKNS